MAKPNQTVNVKSKVLLTFTSLNHIINKRSCDFEELLKSKSNISCIRNGDRPIYEITYNSEVSHEELRKLRKRLFGKSWKIVEKYIRIDLVTEKIITFKQGGTNTRKSVYAIPQPM